MRIAKVIGKITLVQTMPEVLPGSYLVVRPCNRGTLMGKNEGADETVVMYDPLASREGDLTGMVEGREATAAFYPKKVPYDAYNCCILDTLDYQPVLDVE
jgi:microcompartment protein CcmK/EutM